MLWVAKAPPHEFVRTVASQAAERAGVTMTEIMGSQKPPAVRARWAAWREIIDATGCSMNGLATVWGCDRAAILYALRQMAGAA